MSEWPRFEKLIVISVLPLSLLHLLGSSCAPKRLYSIHPKVIHGKYTDLSPIAFKTWKFPSSEQLLLYYYYDYYYCTKSGRGGVALWWEFEFIMSPCNYWTIWQNYIQPADTIKQQPSPGKGVYGCSAPWATDSRLNWSKWATNLIHSLPPVCGKPKLVTRGIKSGLYSMLVDVQSEEESSIYFSIHCDLSCCCTCYARMWLVDLAHCLDPM